MIYSKYGGCGWGGKTPCRPRMLYLEELSFRIGGEIKSFTEKQKLKEFITTKLALREMLKRLQAEKKRC